MKLHQLAEQTGAKTIQLIAITKALEFADLPSPHGGTPMTPERAQQIVAVFRFMRSRQIVEPQSAIAQMQMADATATEEIAVCLRASVADELCRRYPDGSMSDRILRLLGALQSFEQLHAPRQPSQ
ncbi:hypothetical protein [cf. Phormidesmis sp. LEGE 11477]|uniref:hypothetical protein n=1 Tax=cf. Phormidesmis sp. LEGE 11477 TaxID=1828680 RepID=UPI0018826D8B|nr:hypothetical protein [cf. Phormidesmis sp. LEGE 11477]MBE9064255.1 hypothetical protein [cf. Phormidesmis sp. LEGE 11477]